MAFCYTYVHPELVDLTCRSCQSLSQNTNTEKHGITYSASFQTASFRCITDYYREHSNRFFQCHTPFFLKEDH